MRVDVGRDIGASAFTTPVDAVRLADSAMALLGCQTEDDVYGVLGEFLALLIPGSVIVVNELTPDYRFLVTRAVAGASQSPIMDIAQRAGLCAPGMRCAISPGLLSELASGAMTGVEGGLPKLVPDWATRAQEDGAELSPDVEVRVVGIADSQNVRGGVYILTSAPFEGMPVPIIEAITRHCSPALTRISMEQALAVKAERERSDEALEQSRLLQASRIEKQEGLIVLSIDPEYRLLHFNRAYSDVMESMYGTHPRVGMSVLDCIASDEDRAVAKANYARALNGESHSNVRSYGGVGSAYFESFFDPIVSDDTVIGATILARDITQRKQAEVYLEMGRDILQILNEPGDPEDSLDRVIDTLKARTGLDSVGIRLRDGNDFPYHADEGDPADLLIWDDTVVVCAADGVASRDEFGAPRFDCDCGLFFAAEAAAQQPPRTPGGSFWANDAAGLLDASLSENRRIHACHPCELQGCTSMAIVPIKDGRGVVGLMRLGDHRAGRFSLETVELLESVASHIGAALLRRNAEGALRASEEKFRSVVEHTGEGIAVVQNGRIAYGNPALATLTGWLAEEFGNADVLATLGVDGDDSVGRKPKPPGSEEPTTSAVGLLRKDGTPYSAEVSVSPISYRGAPAQMVLVRNITERKEAEERLMRYQARLQALASELVVSREHERARLGVELHDVLGQELAAAKLMAQLLAAEPLDPVAREHAGKLVSLLGESIREIRQLTSDLAPTLLFELGLHSSLLWLRDRYNELYGLRCTVRMSERAKHLQGETAMFLFRVAREALNNVVRHSGALRATLSVGASDGGYTLTVSDRGVGFDAALVDDPGESGGFGLFSIREECRAMGASVEIRSRTGQGTQVRVRVPETAGADIS